jgi:hypothetical protein
VALDPAYAVDVVVEIADPLAHVVVRSADDSTATILLMPVRLDRRAGSQPSRAA